MIAVLLAAALQAVPTVPAPRITGPRRAALVGAKAIDIPAWAKDQGHNGTATYTVTVDADGRVTAIALAESSGSDAIDAAGRARIERGSFTPARDPQGKAIAGTADVRLSYEPWRQGTPGGLSGYSCGNLVRDYDWFTAASRTTRKIFWLENAFVSRDVLVDLQAPVLPSLRERQARKERRSKEWRQLVARCRKAPERTMLSQAPGAKEFQALADSF